MKEEIIQILMRRDTLSREEALEIYQECVEEIQNALDNFCTLDELEDILADYLGLEPDYLIEFLM